MDTYKQYLYICVQCIIIATILLPLLCVLLLKCENSALRNKWGIQPYFSSTRQSSGPGLEPTYTNNTSQLSKVTLSLIKHTWYFHMRNAGMPKHGSCTICGRQGTWFMTYLWARKLQTTDLPLQVCDGFIAISVLWYFPQFCYICLSSGRIFFYIWLALFSASTRRDRQIDSIRRT